MFDFPQSPASGTEVVNGGARYRYDGVKWVAVGGAATYVAKAGDVMTGALTLPGNASSALQAVPLQQVTAQISAAPFVHLAGDTMSGGLSIQKSSPVLYLNNTEAGTEGYVVGQRNGANRWALILLGGSAENGGNSGTNVALNRYNDDGSYLGTPFYIERQSGVATFNHQVNMVAGSTVNSAGGIAYMRYNGPHLWHAGVDNNANFYFYDVNSGIQPMYLTYEGRAVLASGVQDPLALVSSNGTYCRVSYNVSGTRLWTAGVTPDGHFSIADESAPGYRLMCRSDARIDVYGYGIRYGWYDAESWIAFSWDNYGLQSWIDGGNVQYCVRSYGDSAYQNFHKLGLHGGSATVGCWYGNNDYVYWQFTFSDRRLKRNIRRPRRDALDLVNRLAVHQCDYTAPMPGAPTQHLDFSFLADEVAEALPSAYIKAPEPIPGGQEGYDQVRELPLIATLWRAVQQLTERIQAMEARA